MSDAIVFYTNPMSRARTVRWMLEEVGAPYRAEVLPFGDAMRSPEFLRVNPLGKVPAIVHDGRIVTETAAICAYLADAFPQAGLAPAGYRASYYRWLFLAAGPLETAMLNTVFGFEVQPDQRQTAGYVALPAMLDVLEAELAGGAFLSGAGFGAADVFVASLLGWGMYAGMIEARPVFGDYCGRLGARPAFQRAAAEDDRLSAAAG